jgi:uncharacterized protein involved in response to NO
MSTAATPAAARVPPFLTWGFRPFFLGAAIYAVIGMGAWFAYLSGRGDLPSGDLAPSVWHAREMIFGYAIAVVAGFFLTAVPNWTSTRPLAGAPLGLLAAVWLAGRIAVGAGDAAGPWPAAAVDLAFLPALALATVPAIVRARKPQNLVFVALLAVLWAADVLVHLEALGYAADTGGIGVRLAVATLALMIAIVGGRVVPAFTGNALALAGVEGGVTRRPPADRAALLLCAAVVVADLVLPATEIAGVLALAAALALGLRMVGWRTGATLRQPILWVLHLGYVWLIAGYAAKGLAELGGLLPETVALHALTVGAIGTMTLAIMSRAALGHTGRALVAPRLTVIAYLLVSAAALVRVIGAEVLPGSAPSANLLAAALWSSAFAFFVVDYGPILVRREARGG